MSNKKYFSFLYTMRLFQNSFFRFIICVSLFLFSFTYSANAQSEKIVLIVTSYNPDVASMSGTIEEFLSKYHSLGLENPVVLENMNCKSFSEATRWKNRMTAILQKYDIPDTDDSRLAAIVLLGQEAWAAYLSQEPALRKNVPVVGGRVSGNVITLPEDTCNLSTWMPHSRDAIKDLEHDNVITGIAYDYDVDANIRLIMELYPDTRNIAILTDNTYGGVALQAFVRKELNKYSELNQIYLDGRSDDIYSIYKKLAILPENTVLLLGTWRVDNNDSYFMNSATYAMMMANPQVPAFSLSSLGFGHWSIGGYMPVYKPQGADLAVKLNALIGDFCNRDEKINNLSYLPNQYRFDMKKLKEFGIDKKTLPPGSILENNENSFLEEHPYLLLTAISMFIMLVIAFSVVSYYLLKAKRLNAALIRSEYQNDVIINNIGVGLAYLSPDFKVVWESISLVNSNESMPKLREGDYCYRSIFNRDKPCENCPVHGLRIDHSPYEYVYKWKDRFMSVQYNPVYESNDTLKGIVMRVEDVTRKERVKVELQKAKDSAEEADRLKSFFLANMSHEIRTPLNAIVGFSEIMSESTDASEKEEYLRIIKSNNQLLLQLINDILDLSKIEAGTLEFQNDYVDINQLVEELYNIFQPKALEASIDFKISPESSYCCIVSDRNRLSQVLANFLTNAFKFTARGSIELGYELQPNSIRLYVKDTGCGVSEEKRLLIFDRFVKLNSFVQGTGLGLSICKMIATRFGGEIGVDSEIDKGSTFWITIPCLPITSRITAHLFEGPEESYAADVCAGKPTLLVAENDEDNYRLIEAILKKEYNLIHARNGVEAIEMYRYHLPDMVLMDLQMPLIDGYKATEEIRKHSHKVPVLAVTAFGLKKDEDGSASLGYFDDCVFKPINQTSIKEKIKTLLKQNT